MRSAPPVLVLVGRFAWGAYLVWVLALITLLVVVCWIVQVDAGPLTAWCLLLGWLLMGLLSWWCWRRQSWPSGSLHWDGQTWSFEQTDTPGTFQAVQVQVVWDWGTSMCLRLQVLQDGVPTGSVGYACLLANELLKVWHGLRCALHQRDTL